MAEQERPLSSNHYAWAHGRAVIYDKSLLATDPRFNRTVRVQTDDNATFVCPNAFALKFPDPTGYEWTVVFTEHHGIHVYDQDALVWQYANVDVEVVPWDALP